MSSSPPPPPTRLLYNRVLAEDPDWNRNFRIFLLGTLRPTKGGRKLRSTSPVSVLRGMELPVQLIRSFLKPRWKDTVYPVHMFFCGGDWEGWENGLVEALDGYGGDGVRSLGYGLLGTHKNGHNLVIDEYVSDTPGVHSRDGDLYDGKGCLYSMTKKAFAPLKRLVESLCEERNAEGSYLSEMQIRDRFHRCMALQCEMTNETGYVGAMFSCGKKGGKCGVLPGDTIFFTDRIDGPGGYHFTHFEPATREELIERGYHDGRYVYWAALFRNEIAAKRSGDVAEQSRLKHFREMHEKWLRNE